MVQNLQAGHSSHLDLIDLRSVVRGQRPEREAKRTEIRLNFTALRDRTFGRFLIGGPLEVLTRLALSQNLCLPWLAGREPKVPHIDPSTAY